MVSVWIAFHHGTSRRTFQMRYVTWLTSFFNFYLFSMVNSPLFLATPVYRHKIRLRRLHEQIVRRTQEQIWVAVPQISLLCQGPHGDLHMDYPWGAQIFHSLTIQLQSSYKREEMTLILPPVRIVVIFHLEVRSSSICNSEPVIRTRLRTRGTPWNRCGPDEPQGQVLDWYLPFLDTIWVCV